MYREVQEGKRTSCEVVSMNSSWEANPAASGFLIHNGSGCRRQANQGVWNRTEHHGSASEQAWLSSGEDTAQSVGVCGQFLI